MHDRRTLGLQGFLTEVRYGATKLLGSPRERTADLRLMLPRKAQARDSVIPGNWSYDHFPVAMPVARSVTMITIQKRVLHQHLF